MPNPKPNPIELTAKIVSVKCPLCERDYPLNEAMLHSAFACMNCGTLIRASAVLHPDPERVRAPSRRDTQPISRGDTQPIERPNLEGTGLEELDDTLETDPLARLIPKRKKQKGLDQVTMVCVAGAVAMLLIVVAGTLGYKSVTGPAAAPVAPVVAPSVPVTKFTTETAKERDMRLAQQHVMRLAGEIDANKREVLRLQNALREATTKYFAGIQKDLEAARAKGKELAADEEKWRLEYARLSRESP